MFHNATQLFSLTIGIVGLLGGAVGYLAKARQDSIVSGLTKDLIVTKEYNKTLEAEVGRITAERDGYIRQYADAKDLAQGSPQLKIVSGELIKVGTALGRQTAAINRLIKQQTSQESARVKRGKDRNKA